MKLRLCALLWLATLSAGVQQPFSTAANWGSSAAFDAGLFTPLQDLGALTSSEYTTLQHPYFPAHSVRVKQSHFCDGEVQ